MNRSRLLAGIVALLANAAPALGADTPGVELFERRIRPVLIEQCYGCHNSHDKSEGGLILDHRDALREGGDSGPAVVPGKPDDSPLIRALRHQGPSKMPKNGPRLPAAVVADFEKWVSLGAPDPRDHAPPAEEIAALTSWDSIRKQRQKWWSFQPVTRPKAPELKNPEGSTHPIDRFIRARLEQPKLEPAAPADRRTLIRRVSFALTGLPPTPAEIDRFLKDESPRAYEDLVDRLLLAPEFGERWARHWMDWLRYADSHGSEGDPTIPHAWRYRDYLIRALNDDVPYDRLVREHVAGDLLPDPRINPDLQINESAVGPAHLRMVAHGYSPTDALDELVTFTDNQIDVLSKAFLGLTVSCARCHDHKFDAIGQSDFYALFGVLASSRPALITIDTPARAATNRQELERCKSQIRARLASRWSTAADDIADRLNDPSLAFTEAVKQSEHPLHAWAVLRECDVKAFRQGWDAITSRHRTKTQPEPVWHWDLAGKDSDRWFRHGNGMRPQPANPGDFHLNSDGDRVISGIDPSGVSTHGLSTRHNGVFTSPRFKIETNALSVLAAGGGGARVRLVVENYPRSIPLIYKANDLKVDTPRWIRWDTRYWKGDWAYIEFATGGDLPVEALPDAERSWFLAISAVAHGDDWTPPSRPALFADEKPTCRDELASLYASTLHTAIDAWSRDAATDAQAEFLDAFLRLGLLPNTLDTLPGIAALVAEYRRLEAEIPLPIRAPGVLEGTAFDQPLFVRGDTKTPKEPIARRFLEAFDGRPYHPQGSGRLELARSLGDLNNPLVSRVIVNRVWHHLFGVGIVATPDNFGRMGELPTHPELLDELAARFAAEGGSLKGLIRLIVTSQTYQQSSQPISATAERDPTNALLAHFPVRRLEAEPIRDAILAVSGRLDDRRFGPAEPGTSTRRSVYVRVQRNDLDPFLHAFDAPEPLSTRGRRDTTNVPAQSLTLLNDDWVRDQARRWAERVATIADDRDAVRIMFETALGRPPTSGETDASLRFLDDEADRRRAARRETERIAGERAEKSSRVAALTGPVRDRLSARDAQRPATGPLPEPLALWEFDADLRDSRGMLHGKGEGNAHLDAGALVLDGKSFVSTPPLARALTAKTLEAWVALDDKDQRGGGVITVETLNGGVFDALVFGEQTPRHWLAGSNFFDRTKPFEGEPESLTGPPIHLALVYASDGTITAYRNGQTYGKPYRSPGLQRFDAGQSHVVFGLRHSPLGGNKMLTGRILRAALYDRALDAAEVAATAANTPSGYITDAQILAALLQDERSEVGRLRVEIEALGATLRRRASPDDERPESIRRRQDLAHALFNLKEFIYLR